MSECSEKKGKPTAGKIVMMVIGGIAFCFLFGFVIQGLWNWLMPLLFGLKQVTYWEGLGIWLLCMLLFKGSSPQKHINKKDRRSMRDEIKKEIKEEIRKEFAKEYGKEAQKEANVDQEKLYEKWWKPKARIALKSTPNKRKKSWNNILTYKGGRNGRLCILEKASFFCCAAPFCGLQWNYAKSTLPLPSNRNSSRKRKYAMKYKTKKVMQVRSADELDEPARVTAREQYYAAYKRTREILPQDFLDIYENHHGFHDAMVPYIGLLTKYPEFDINQHMPSEMKLVIIDDCEDLVWEITLEHIKQISSKFYSDYDGLDRLLSSSMNYCSTAKNDISSGNAFSEGYHLKVVFKALTIKELSKDEIDAYKAFFQERQVRP